MPHADDRPGNRSTGPRARVILAGGDPATRARLRRWIEACPDGPAPEISEEDAGPEPPGRGWPRPPDLELLWRRVEDRMGTCPSFFRLARHEPAIAWALFGLAEFAYLDSPIPSLLKEQLFVYLSRFCPVTYCLARHCAFLLGRGTIAGDRLAPSVSVEQTRRLLEEPLPSDEALPASLERLEATPPAADWPAWDSELGYHLRVGCTQVFLHGHRASRWHFALQRLLGRSRYEQLALLLGFIRLAHFWTEVHPELETEAEVHELLREHEELSASLARAAGRVASPTPRLEAELVELRRQAQTARQVRELADALPAYISYVDADQRFVFANQAYATGFALATAEIVGRSVRSVLGERAHQAISPRLEAALRGERMHFDERLPIPGQGERDLDVTYVPDRRPDGSVAGCYVLAMDVTVRKQAEEALARAHALLDAVTATAPDPIFAKDRQGRTLLANRAASEVLGKPASALLGRDDAAWHDDPAQARAVAASDQRLMASGAVEVVEEELVTPRGLRILSTTKAPLRDGTGAVIGLVGVSHDVTEERRKEQALRRSEERLRESDHRKDVFLAVLGHELRSPLAAIRHASGLIDHLSRREPHLTRIYGVLDRQLTHMTRLIDGLLEVSRIARGKVDLERTPLDLRAVLEGVLQDREAELAGRPVGLERTLPAEPVWVLGDEIRLAQVFDNLVGNAIKFTEQGTIYVELRADGRTAEVVVRDTGPGLRREALATIFEPFQQDVHALTRAAGGLGLGLAVVKGLVQLHDGEVEARSDGPGTGAELVVRLPLSAPPRREPAPPAATAGPPGLRILVVEDHDDAAGMLQELLSLQGHEVLVAADGPQALTLLRDRGAQLVLCDIGLPGMSGHELARAVRQDPALRGTALVALTGLGQSEDRRRSQEAGFDVHLVKPVDLETLERTMRELARRRA